MRKPKAIVLVAETECCGLKVVPTEPVDHPRHWDKLASKWQECRIVRVWEYTARRLHVVKARV